MIKKNENGSYSVDIRPNGRNGRRFRKQLSSHSEALAYQRHIMANADKEPWQQKKDSRHLSDLIETWHHLHGQTLKSGDTRRKELLVLCEKMGNPRADKFTARMFTDFRAKRLETVTPNTVNHDLTYLRAMFNELRRLDEWHRPNPLADVRKIRHDERELDFLSKEQISRLLEALDEHPESHARITARICLATGARWGEVCQLKASQIRAGKIHLTGTKSGKNRSIPISEELQQLIKDHAPLIDGTNTFKRAIQRTSLRLPRGQMTHILRHTFASHFMMNGGNIITLQRVLGHGSLAMTVRYAHLSPDHLTEVLSLNPLSAST